MFLTIQSYVCGTRVLILTAGLLYTKQFFLLNKLSFIIYIKNESESSSLKYTYIRIYDFIPTSNRTIIIIFLFFQPKKKNISI